MSDSDDNDSDKRPFPWGAFVSSGEQEYEIFANFQISEDLSFVHLLYKDLKGKYPKNQAVLLVSDDDWVAALTVGRYGTIHDDDGNAMFHYDFYSHAGQALLGTMSKSPHPKEVALYAVDVFTDPPLGPSLIRKAADDQ